MKIYGVAPQVVQGSKIVQVRPEQGYITPVFQPYVNNDGLKALEAQAYINAQAINFGYDSILKDLFREGKMPTVKNGLYGNPINDGNVSLEHLKPKSLGGGNVLSNFALADKKANMKRGNKPLSMFLDKDMLEGYLEQFNFEVPGRFNGFRYQEMIRKTCKDLGVGSKKIEVPELFLFNTGVLKIDYGNIKDVIAHIDDIDVNMLSKKMLKSLRNRGYILK